MSETIHERLNDKKWVVGDCWRWLGACASNGRPHVTYKGKTVTVARLSAHLYLGFDLNSLKLVLHKDSICNFKDCWNPKHLYIGTEEDNMLDVQNKITYCPQGHEYTEENSYFVGNTRMCLNCKRARGRIYTDEGRLKRKLYMRERRKHLANRRTVMD